MPDVIDVLKTAHRNTTLATPFDLDESIRRCKSRQRRRRFTSAGVGVALAAALGVGFLFPGTSSDRPDPAHGERFAILDELQGETDKLPPSIREEAGPLDESSTRLVGEYDDLSYWLGTDHEGHICLVAAEDGTWLSTGCGAGTLVEVSHGSTTALAFPDDATLSIARHAGFMVISDNLAISTLSNGARRELAETLEDGTDYYAVFSEPQRPTDRLPDESRGSANDAFVDSASRLLGGFTDVQFWISAARDGSSETLTICIVSLATTEERFRMSCRGEADGLGEPIDHVFDDAGSLIRAVPAGYELSDETAEWIRLNDTWSLYYVPDWASRG